MAIPSGKARRLLCGANLQIFSRFLSLILLSFVIELANEKGPLVCTGGL